LSPVLIGECRHSLQVDNYLLETNEVRFVPLSQNLATVSQFQFLLRRERYLLKSKFDLATLLVDRLQEATPFILVDIEAGPDDGVAFLFEQDFRHPLCPLAAHETHEKTRKRLRC
jgi:hypothetical protein